MKLVTVATSSEYYFPWLKQSCQRFNQEITVLGWGQPWKGFVWRFKLMLQYLQTLSPNEIVCFIDGYDVIMLRPLHEMETLFKETVQGTDYKIIVGHEDIKTFYNKIGSILVFGQCKNKPLNAGTYVGYAHELHALLKEMYDSDSVTDKTDDQILLSKYCRNNANKIMIDVNSKFFATIVHKEIYPFITIKNNEVIYKNTKPFFLHAPALGCLNKVIKQLGYPFTLEDEKIIQDYRHKAGIQKKEYYSQFQLKYFLIVLVILFVIIKIWKRV